MKSFSVIVAVSSLFLIILTSPPNSHPDSAGSLDRTTAYWVNPDGSRGLLTGRAGESSGSARREHVWINPDGVGGTGKADSQPSRSKNYSWTNPDGATGTVRAVHARTDGRDMTF
ncbi:MAG TPA: hypothetical protein VJ805_14915 [Nitrospiraceae bacterium]|nr:hypothetical protein [Nitrospiraceae bacterium]